MVEGNNNALEGRNADHVLEEAGRIVLEGFSRERTSFAQALRRDRLLLIGELSDPVAHITEDRKEALKRQLEGLDQRLIRTLIFDF